MNLRKFVPAAIGAMIIATSLAPSTASAQRFHRSRFHFGLNVFIGSPPPYYYDRPVYVYREPPCDPVYCGPVYYGYPVYERHRFHHRHFHRW